MKRLIEDEGLESADRRLAELFRAAAPFEVDPFRKRRILVRLERTPARNVGRFWVRPVVLAALLVSGTATAALGHRYVAQRLGMLGSRGSERTTAASVLPVAHRPSAVQHAAPAVVQPAAETVEPPALPTPEPRPSVHPKPKAGARVRADSGEDATHVVEAIQALRTERDPARAQALLDDYLTTHPRGVLSGDALALSIEAASARRDPRAADYARRYLAAFPKGKYRELATRALEMQR